MGYQHIIVTVSQRKKRSARPMCVVDFLDETLLPIYYNQTNIPIHTGVSLHPCCLEQFVNPYGLGAGLVNAAI
jgi:hypothetical protein